MSIWNYIRRLFSYKKSQEEKADNVSGSEHGIDSSEPKVVAEGQEASSDNEPDDGRKDAPQVPIAGMLEKPEEKETGDKEGVTEDPPPPPDTLLDNKEYIHLLEECADLIKEFEQYHSRMQTEEGKMMVELIGQRLREAMLLSGAQSIDSDRTFNILRHTPVPMHYVPTDTPLEEIIEMGIAVENRVFVKAKVKVKE